MRLTAPAIATLLTLSSALVGSDLSAQIRGEPIIILRQNQLIPSLGMIQSMSRIAVSDQGTVFTQATITTNTLRYMMRDDFATFVNNVPVPEPGLPGIYMMRTAGQFSSFELDKNTNVAWRLQTNNSGTGTGVTGNHTAIYYNLKLIHNDRDSAHTLAGIQDPFSLSASDLSSFGYESFFNVVISNDNRLVISCEVDSNGIATGGNVGRAIIMVEIDEVGNILNETLLALSSTAAAPTRIGSSGVPNLHNAIDIADNGHWIANLQLSTINGFPTTAANDWVIVADSLDNIIAQEGTFIPMVGNVAGNGGNSSRVSINSQGQTAFTVRLNNGDDQLIANGSLLVADGGAAANLPSLAPNAVLDLESSTGSPLYISDSGDVYWAARLTGPTGNNRAYMRNREVIIRKGVTTLDGVLIRDTDNTERGFALSNSGRFWAGQIKLGGGGDDAVVLLDFGLVVPIPGCDPNPSTLVKTSGDARLGELLVFGLNGSQGPGSIPVMQFSLAPANAGNPCGNMTKFGELYLNFTPGLLLTQLTGSPVTSGSSSIAANIPLDPSLVGLQVYAQGVFVDLGQSHGGLTFNLTNGLRIIVGAS